MPKSKTPEPSTEVEIVSPKRVAADGTQRGLHRKGKKSRHTQLMEDVQRAVEAQTGTVNWDPVVMMAVVAEQARVGYPAVDEEGRPVIDEVTGKQLMVPPDNNLAVAAAAKVAPYLHQQLRPKDMADGDDAATDPEDKKEEFLNRLAAMGVQPTKATKK